MFLCRTDLPKMVFILPISKTKLLIIDSPPQQHVELNTIYYSKLNFIAFSNWTKDCASSECALEKANKLEFRLRWPCELTVSDANGHEPQPFNKDMLGTNAKSQLPFRYARWTWTTLRAQNVSASTNHLFTNKTCPFLHLCYAYPFRFGWILVCFLWNPKVRALHLSTGVGAGPIHH